MRISDWSSYVCSSDLPKKSITPMTGLNLLLRSSTCCLRTTSCSFFCCFSRRSSARSSSTLVILFIVFFSLKKVPDKDVGQRAFDIIPFDHPDHYSDEQVEAGDHKETASRIAYPLGYQTGKTHTCKYKEDYKKDTRI